MPPHCSFVLQALHRSNRIVHPADRLVHSLILILSFLFLGGEEQPPWIGNCDANTDGTLDISDPIYILSYLFQGGPPPAPWL